MYLHQSGINVYVRESTKGVPLKIIDPGRSTDGEKEFHAAKWID